MLISHGCGTPISRGPPSDVAAGFRQAKAFVAGLLIGLSVGTPVFVATAAEGTEWQKYGLPWGLAMFGTGVWLRTGKSLRRGQKALRPEAGQSRPGMDRLVA